MKILHIAPNAPYNDYWGYQENLLPKYHKKLGHDVTIITTNTMHKDGKIIETDCRNYVLNDGVRVIRLARKQYFYHTLTDLNSRLDIWNYLIEIKPDFVFFHGLISTTIYDVIRYKKKINKNMIIVQDNHLDYNIGRSSITWKDKLVRAFYRYINRKSFPYVDRVYGVTPWRKIFAEDYFRIPSSKTDILIMGADDENMDFRNKDKIRRAIREKYSISDSDYLIVTGGKIDKKKKIDILIKACVNITNVKLLIFGNVAEDINSDFQELIKADNIIYIGWIESDKVYKYFYAADLVFFPGQHSVLWEQACASKVPCVFERWEGMDHVNNGGNSDFVTPITEEKIAEEIKMLRFSAKYYEMKLIAESEATDIYLYSNIAKKSLETVKI